MFATSWSPPLNLGSAKSIACRAPSNGSAIMDQAISPRTQNASRAISDSSRSRPPWRAHSPTAWPRPSCERSNATTPASIQRQTPKPSSKACQAGSSTTIGFIRTAPCAIVRHESSSLRNQTGDRDRFLGGINILDGGKTVGTPFFDIEDEVFVKVDLWLISSVAVTLMDFFFGVAHDVAQGG